MEGRGHDEEAEEVDSVAESIRQHQMSSPVSLQTVGSVFSFSPKWGHMSSAYEPYSHIFCQVTPPPLLHQSNRDVAHDDVESPQVLTIA